MNRIHFVEICDKPWCPSVIRDGATDLLRCFENTGKYFDCIVDKLKKAVNHSRTRRIIDLASGGGGPWFRLYDQLNSTMDGSFELVLTDRFPNEKIIRRVKDELSDEIQYYPEEVNAREVPPKLNGFRTMFTSFHHFKPTEALAILEDAVSKDQGIAIFEFTERRLVTILLICLGPFMAFVMAPFIRPFYWRRLFWTYLIPLIPLVLLHDGYVSCLRTYSLKEMKNLISKIPESKYTWDVGKCPVPPGLLRITYTIGYPKNPGNS
ncbi:class I SAM-dependent methyltransferase [Planctomycetota bacterium]